MMVGPTDRRIVVQFMQALQEPAKFGHAVTLDVPSLFS
jgi:hypothetical protein